MENQKSLKQKSNSKFTTYNEDKKENGFVIPIYNVNDSFCEKDKQPQQTYLTVVRPGEIKGPHLHFIRTGYFTCIKGNVRIVVKVKGNYETYYSGEDYNYSSIIIPTGIPAAIQNTGKEDAFLLNMPSPAWTPEMNDEHSADFSDFDFNTILK